MRTTTKLLLLLLIAVAGFASPAFARPGVVRTIDNLTYEGDIVQRPDDVTVTNHGIKTTIPRDQILAITWASDEKPNLEAIEKKLPPRDVNGRMQLARTAFENHEYLLARKILRDVMEIDPNNRDAADFYELIRAQIELERRQAIATTRPTTLPTAAQANANALAHHYVSIDDINNIRQMEITPRDINVRIRFENDVLRRYALVTNQDFSQFKLLRPLQQFFAIRAGGTYDMLKDVKILSDPVSITEYRRNIQPLVLAGCASAGCHGTAGKGDFQLFPATEDAPTYTNFYILSTYTRVIPAAPGSNAPGMARAMIDRSLPGESLLLEYSLPPAVAQYAHPPIRGGEYRGFVRGRNDPRFLIIANWITNTLSQVMPRYNVDYRPMFLRAATSAPLPGSLAPATPLSPQEIRNQSQQPIGEPRVSDPNIHNGNGQ